MNLIFPIAGEGSRFNYEFKPFLQIGDKRFIEFAYEPFIKWKHMINNIYFVCTKEQEKENNVSSTIKSIIEHKNVHIVTIPEKTNGPYETILMALQYIDINEISIICDCDHHINVDPIFEYLKKNENFDAIIPIWNIKKDKQKNWSKVVCDSSNNINHICEKKIIENTDANIFGIIGCYVFKNISFFKENNFTYFSEILEKFRILNKNLALIKINNALFYGDLPMYENCVNILRKKATIFCDIDGTLIKHEDHPSYDSNDIEPFNNVICSIRKLYENNKIVLTTARSQKYKKETVDILNKYNIRFDDIIMGLPPGPRFLINDHKPSKIFTSQSTAIEVERNMNDDGLEQLINNVINSNDINIIKILKGNSFAKVYLIYDSGTYKVRKYILTKNKIHYLKLRKQVDDMKRIEFLLPNSIPKILNTTENSYHFYYDMEYLENYLPLTNYNIKIIIPVLIKIMYSFNKNIYSFKKEIDGNEWIQNHYDLKIYPKLKIFSEQYDVMDWLINSTHIYINDVKFNGLNHILRNIDINDIKPSFICPIHGDLTLENILYNIELDDYKLIDPDGADYFDAPELDFGKLCQILLTRYDYWSNMDNIISDWNNKTNTISVINDFFDETQDIDFLIKIWEKILYNTNNSEKYNIIKNKGIFYMSMYLIRFIPFRLNISLEHGIFALIMAIVWLSKIK